MTSTRKRESAEIRQRQLIEAAIETMSRHGAASLSVRLIASTASVSPGLITHHFGSVENLLAIATEEMGGGFLSALAERVEKAGSDHRSRLEACVSACFEPPALTPNAAASWLTIIGLAQSMPQVAQAHRKIGDAALALFRSLFAAVDEPPLDDAPLILVAFIEGLWMEIARSMHNLTLPSAQALALRCLDRQLASTGR